MPILVILLRILHYGALKTLLGNPPESITTGYYGQPPKTTWWLKQLLIYFMGLLGMKVFVFFIFQICPWIVKVGDWALRWTEGNEDLQIFFVMLFFPLVMNALQYYIIDGFIKNQKPPDHEHIPRDDEGQIDNDEVSPRTSGVEDGEEADFIKKSSQKNKEPKLGSLETTKYDPNQDGDGSPTVTGMEEAALLSSDALKAQGRSSS